MEIRLNSKDLLSCLTMEATSQGSGFEIFSVCLYNSFLSCVLQQSGMVCCVCPSFCTWLSDKGMLCFTRERLNMGPSESDSSSASCSHVMKRVITLKLRIFKGQIF